MKLLALLIMSAMLSACASHDRQIASEEQQRLEEVERVGEFGRDYRY